MQETEHEEPRKKKSAPVIPPLKVWRKSQDRKAANMAAERGGWRDQWGTQTAGQGGREKERKMCCGEMLMPRKKSGNPHGYSS